MTFHLTWVRIAPLTLEPPVRIDPWGAPTGSALDDCDDAPELTFSYSDAAPVFACGDAGGMTIARTHTLVAEDRCNNADTVSCVQIITLLDVTGPGNHVGSTAAPTTFLTASPIPIRPSLRWARLPRQQWMHVVETWTLSYRTPMR